jgi:hypothetical protein
MILANVLLGISLGPASKPITIKRATANSAANLTPEGSLIEGETDLRQWCTGLPPKRSYLGADSHFAHKPPYTRRSTLADKPELDVLLAATMIEYKGHFYLPLTAHTIRRLSPYWKGEKPIADTKLFDCIMITCEINGVHADHVVAALGRIGCQCKYLLVVSPIQTSELGNVFNREAGNISSGNDWDHILECFPKLEYLALLNPINEPLELGHGTFHALRTAVAHRQAAQQAKDFKHNGSPRLLTNIYDEMDVAST